MNEVCKNEIFLINSLKFELSINNNWPLFPSVCSLNIQQPNFKYYNYKIEKRLKYLQNGILIFLALKFILVYLEPRQDDI